MLLLAAVIVQTAAQRDNDKDLGPWADTHDWAIREPKKVNPVEGQSREARLAGDGQWNDLWQDRMNDFRNLAEDAAEENAQVLNKLAAAPEPGSPGSQAYITAKGISEVMDAKFATGAPAQNDVHPLENPIAFVELRRAAVAADQADPRKKATELESLLEKIEALGAHDADVGNLRKEAASSTSSKTVKTLSRPGRCGSPPYLQELGENGSPGTFAECQQQCLDHPECHKFEHEGSAAESGKCNYMGLDSGVRTDEPNGDDAWSCSIVLTSDALGESDWKLSATSASCDATCIAADKICNERAFGRLSTIGAVTQAFEMAGVQCSSYAPKADDFSFIGPVASGSARNKVCSFATIPGVDCAGESLDNQRICPCRSCQSNDECPEQQECNGGQCKCPEGTERATDGQCHTPEQATEAAAAEEEGATPVAGSLMRSDDGCRFLDDPLCDWVKEKMQSRKGD